MPVDSVIVPTEVLIMNIRENLIRRVACTSSVMLLALFLTATTFAQGPHSVSVSEGGVNDLVKQCISGVSNHRDPRNTVGFGESNPAGQEAKQSTVRAPSFIERSPSTFAGFTEEDPAVQLGRRADMALWVSNEWVSELYFGFSETDPTGGTAQSGESTARLAKASNFCQPDRGHETNMRCLRINSHHREC